MGQSAVALAFLLMIGACAAVPRNTPLPVTSLNDASGPISKGGYRLTALPQKETGSDSGASARKQNLSSIGQILGAVSGTQIDSYNFEPMILARSQLEVLRDAIAKRRCNQSTKALGPCQDAQASMVHLSLADIPDPKTRERLQAIPTGLGLNAEDIALLVDAGRRQVLDSPELAHVRDSLTPNESKLLTTH